MGIIKMGKGVKHSADTEGPRRIKEIINQISFVYEKKKKIYIIYTHIFLKYSNSCESFSIPTDHSRPQ